MDHEVLDFPRMIAKLEGMNMRQENPEGRSRNGRTPERIKESIATNKRNPE
jgi:hypothetical protein